MTINDKTLENLSKLSKIKIDDNLRDKLKEDLNLTMNMIDKINKIDCDQIEELSHPIKDNFNERNRNQNIKKIPIITKPKDLI